MRMRKICALTAALALAVCLASCGKKDSNDGLKEKSSEAETSAAEKEENGSDAEKEDDSSSEEESKTEDSSSEGESSSAAEESAAEESKDDASSAADEGGTTVIVEETTTEEGGDNAGGSETSSTDVSDHNQVAADTAAASLNVMIEGYLLEQDLLGDPVTDLVISKDGDPALYEQFESYANGGEYSVTIEGGKVKKIWLRMEGDDGNFYESVIEN